ncbi:MAG: glycosyltransferase family 4 protein [Azonexus sp.]|nr:glycosyltransferase family 4 protein [Azonexus sp.]
MPTVCEVAEPFVWFPAIRTGSGADVFTERLANSLRKRGARAEISWLPHRAEFLPWSVGRPTVPVGANIVHVNSWLHTRFIPPDIPVVATMLHCVLDPALSPYKTSLQSIYHQFWVQRLERRILARACKVIAISQYTERSMHEIYATKRSVVIPIGIDLEKFSPSWRSAPNQPFRLLYVGNWSARKGADLLSPIMKELGPGFELRILAGLRGKELSGLAKNIRQIPRLPDVAAMVSLYRECDALLFPSRLEGFGLVAQEAQACGIPVIASKSSALPEIINDGETGILCEQDSISDFVSAVRTLSDSRLRWKMMGRSARAYAEESFSNEVMADRYIGIYRSVLSSDGEK